MFLLELSLRDDGIVVCAGGSDQRRAEVVGGGTGAGGSGGCLPIIPGSDPNLHPAALRRTLLGRGPVAPGQLVPFPLFPQFYTSAEASGNSPVIQREHPDLGDEGGRSSGTRTPPGPGNGRSRLESKNLLFPFPDGCDTGGRYAVR